MKLTDILPLEKWVELEKEINKRSSLESSVFDTDGMRITGYKVWANNLCPAIKATSKGQTFICSMAHQNVAAQAEKTGKPVVNECDAGLVKIVVPIFYGGSFVGAFGACGLLMGDSEVESFLVHMTTEIDEKKIEELSDGIGTLSESEAESLAQFIRERLEAIVSK